MTTRESQLLVEEVAAAFGRGEIVVVADDDDRENEGDLFVAASLCTPEKMAFIIRHTSGLVCAPLSAEEAKRLHLDPMVALNDAPLGTAFTVTVALSWVATVPAGRALLARSSATSRLSPLPFSPGLTSWNTIDS